jgi:hypothetical protein
MVPSSALCRSQESLHLRRAANTQLDNVRAVAVDAAAAWGKEAVAAERREGRQAEVRLSTKAAAARKADLDASNDLLLSENPDRGFAPISSAS